MSRTAEIELAWPDARRKYRLGIAELRELQEKCNAGPMEILNRLEVGRWRIEDLGEIVRLGAVGGGMPLADAVIMVERNVYARPLVEAVPWAYKILAAVVVGFELEPIPGGTGGADGGKTTAEESSASSISTQTERSSDSALERSTV